MSLRGTLFVLATLVAASEARADFTATPSVVSDNDFRGISWSARNPATQLDLSYTDPDGLYVDVTGSTVNFGPGNPRIEADASAGVNFAPRGQYTSYDFGAVYHSFFVAHGLDYPEIYAGATQGWFSGKLYFTWDFSGSHESAYYATGVATMPLPQRFALELHAGYSGGDYWDRFYGRGYFDWSAGITRKLGPLSVGLYFIDGSNLPSGPSRVLSTQGRLVARVSTTLPWQAD